MSFVTRDAAPAHVIDGCVLSAVPKARARPELVHVSRTRWPEAASRSASETASTVLPVPAPPLTKRRGSVTKPSKIARCASVRRTSSWVTPRILERSVETRSKSGARIATMRSRSSGRTDLRCRSPFVAASSRSVGRRTPASAEPGHRRRRPELDRSPDRGHRSAHSGKTTPHPTLGMSPRTPVRNGLSALAAPPACSIGVWVS